MLGQCTNIGRQADQACTGRITSGVNAGKYLNWSIDVGYWLGTIPSDGYGTALVPFRTAAADDIALTRGTQFKLVAPLTNAKSPLYKADKATQPILIMHGINDPRVKLEQSDMMVAALQKAGKQVDYVTFKGDGHGNMRWNNNLAMMRKTEDFLATCLGGRSSGFDYYQLGAWAF